MILTADDFGMSPWIDEAVLCLAQKKRVSAISCMVVGAGAGQYSKDLKAVAAASGIELGLHFTLSDSRPCLSEKKTSSLTDREQRFLPFAQLAVRSFAGFIDRVDVEEEFFAQLGKFREAFGKLPDFIDGHEHVQQLPTICEVLCTAIKSIPKTPERGEWRPYLRAADLAWNQQLGEEIGLRSMLAAHAISLLGRKSKAYWQSRGLATNNHLLGYFHHRSKKDLRKILMTYLLSSTHPNDILFCHPGKEDPADSLSRVRPLVFEILNSSFFDDHIARRLNRFQF